MPTLTSFTSPEPDIFTLEDDTTDPRIRYGFGVQQVIVPPSLSLNDLNLLVNPFNKVAMAVVQPIMTQNENDYSPQSPKPSKLSPSTEPKYSDGWGTPHTTTDDNTFDSEDEPRRVHWNYLRRKLFIRRANPDEIISCVVHPRHHHLARRRGNQR